MHLNQSPNFGESKPRKIWPNVTECDQIWCSQGRRRRNKKPFTRPPFYLPPVELDGPDLPIASSQLKAGWTKQALQDDLDGLVEEVVSVVLLDSPPPAVPLQVIPGLGLGLIKLQQLGCG